MTDVASTETPAEKLEKAVEAAGFAPPSAAPAAAAPTASVEEVAPSVKERIAEIAAELPKASPSGVEALAGELAALAEQV
jgi:hypothetical protein